MPIYDRYKSSTDYPCSIIDLLFNQPKSSLINIIQSKRMTYLPFEEVKIK